MILFDNIIEIFDAFPWAGRLQAYFGKFDSMANAGWGTATDLIPIAHGPIGCGYYTHAERSILPGRIQGIESFSEHHFTTALGWDDMDHKGGDVKLARSLAEIDALFPLAKGSLILAVDPIGLVESDIHAVARARNERNDKLVIALSAENHRVEAGPWWVLQELAVFRLAAERVPAKDSTPYDVALTFMRYQTGLCWIVGRLLGALGLNVIYQRTGTSTAEISRATRCKLSIGFAPMLDVPNSHIVANYPRMLEKRFNISRLIAPT